MRHDNHGSLGITPIRSMHGIFTFIGLKFMVNVRKYSIHAAFGTGRSLYNLILETKTEFLQALQDLCLQGNFDRSNSAGDIPASWQLVYQRVS